MGISHDIKPRKIVRPHTKSAAKNTSFDILTKPKEEPKSSPQFLISQDDFEKKETLENDFFNPTISEHTSTKHDQGNGKFTSTLAHLLSTKRLIWVAAIAITSLVIYQNYADIKTQLKEDFASTSLEEETETPSINNTETKSEAANAETATPATTTTETTNPTTTTPVTTTPAATTATTASVSIKLLNGNGIAGSADQAKAILETAGYVVSKTGNARTFTYSKTNIYYKTGKNVEAEALKAVLSKYTTVLQKSDSITTGYDIVIVIGKN